MAAGYTNRATLHFTDVKILKGVIDTLTQAGVTDVSLLVNFWAEYPTFVDKVAKMQAAGIDVNRKFYFDLGCDCVYWPPYNPPLWPVEQEQF